MVVVVVVRFIAHLPKPETCNHLTPLKVFTTKRARKSRLHTATYSEIVIFLHKAIFVGQNAEIIPCLSEEPVKTARQFKQQTEQSYLRMFIGTRI